MPDPVGKLPSELDQLPDRDADREMGVLGVPQRLSPDVSLTLATALLLGASGSIAFGAGGVSRRTVSTFGASCAVSGATRPNLEGPFYKPDPPERINGTLLERKPGDGASILCLRGILRDAVTGKVIANAALDFWQADEHGTYDKFGFNLRGVIRSNAAGKYQVLTVVPVDYSENKRVLVDELRGLT